MLHIAATAASWRYAARGNGSMLVSVVFFQYCSRNRIQGGINAN